MAKAYSKKYKLGNIIQDDSGVYMVIALHNEKYSLLDMATYQVSGNEFETLKDMEYCYQSDSDRVVYDSQKGFK